jgi:hypothetical protein
MARTRLWWLAVLVALAGALHACKLPYRTLTQVLVVPYRSLIADGSLAGEACLRAPGTDLAVPPEAKQLQVRAARLRLTITNEGPAQLLVTPHLAPRGTDPYSQPGLEAGGGMALSGRGDQLERAYPLAAPMFKAEAWTIGLRVTTPGAWLAETLGPGDHLEVRWQIDVDASLM